MSEEVAGAGDQRRREYTARALADYVPLWKAWAEGEKPRRRTISLYGDLFMLKSRIEAEETSTPSELVWGMGVAAWKFAGTLTDNGNGKDVSVDYQYPLLTQVVEVDLDPQTHSISVRPRAVAPRLEFDAFGACQVTGVAEVEKQARVLLESDSDRLLTPFDTGSFEPIFEARSRQPRQGWTLRPKLPRVARIRGAFAGDGWLGAAAASAFSQFPDRRHSEAQGSTSSR